MERNVNGNKNFTIRMPDHVRQMLDDLVQRQPESVHSLTMSGYICALIEEKYKEEVGQAE